MPLSSPTTSSNGIDSEHAAAHEVLLDDSLNHLRSSGVVPNAFRIDHRDRPLFTHPEAVGFRAINAVEQVQFRKSAL
jgi:hypothetical protein